MTPGSSGSSRGKLWLWYCISLLLEARQPQVGDLGDVPTSYWNYLFWGSSLFLPCSALAANLSFSWWNGNLPLGWAADLQDWLSPQVCTRAAFPFVDAGAIWAFLQWVLTCIWCWGSFVSTDCYLGTFANGSDVCLPLRTVCEHEALLGILLNGFWHLTTVEDHLWAPGVIWVFCQLLLIFDYRWGPFVSGKCLGLCTGHLWRGFMIDLSFGVWVYFHLYNWYSCCLM